MVGREVLLVSAALCPFCILSLCCLALVPIARASVLPLPVLVPYVFCVSFAAASPAWLGAASLFVSVCMRMSVLSCIVSIPLGGSQETLGTLGSVHEYPW